MNQEMVNIIASRMLAEARALRAAFPDADAMRELSVSPLPPGPGVGSGDHHAALGYLRDEMLFVRAGGAFDLTVLDDEMTCVERLLDRV